MKRSGNALIYLIVWAIVIFVSFVIGICIREVRFYRAGTVIERKIEKASKVNNIAEKAGKEGQPVQETAAKEIPTDKSKERTVNRSAEQGTEETRGNTKERFANTPEEEKAQKRNKISDTDRARFRAEMQKERERYLNMSEEEKEQFKDEMREKFKGRQPRKDGEGDRDRQGGSQNNEEKQVEQEDKK
ncbi:MAG: hypothetical protein JW837_16150 [Sedimentisphaerales bacterium]|nr:hypothetical protein [Sedimentisphaerales bacterium]